jgi:hypothetical protein
MNRISIWVAGVWTHRRLTVRGLTVVVISCLAM